jgi:hypothetical protein
MYRNTHEATTSNPLSWNPSYSANIASTGDDEVAADVDEPPDLRKKQATMAIFQRTLIKGVCHTSSLLTKAIQSETQDQGYDKDGEGDSTEDEAPSAYAFMPGPRRRSMASNISIASTAELTSDTGMTGPSRASTPSPPHTETSILRIPSGLRWEPEIRPIMSPAPHPGADMCRNDMTPKAEVPKKRISFACGNPPSQVKRAPVPPLARPPPLVKSPSADRAPRQTRIKFACPARPSSSHNTPSRDEEAIVAAVKVESPSTPKKSAFTLRASQSPRPSPPRRQSKSPAPPRRPKLLRASSSDMTSDASHFHEFASNGTHEDEWIRQEKGVVKKKITIDDTLVMENNIRRLAKEVEEEAELEEEGSGDNDDNDDDDDDDQDDENEDDDVDQNDDDEDEYDSYDSDDTDDSADFSDGYRTDEETGFADSDDSEEEELFWTPGTGVIIPGATYSNFRRSSIAEQLSDTSITGGSFRWSERRSRGSKRVSSRPQTPDLPDSTDFVCGTLDEDRPLEEAYMSALEARKREKLHVIPQDIDPSFPMSEPEDEDDNGAAGSKRNSSDDALIHGEMDDLHHEEGRARRLKKDHVSPRRFRSPPPKRVMSPPLKVRGRSPCRGVAGRTSPRRARSPAPFLAARLMSPAPAHAATCFNISMAKSLPKPTGMLHQIRNGRRRPTTGIHAHQNPDGHMRGAIDIVKGLEQKRKRRREKFLKNYCDRARKGQLPERKAVPAGLGAEKMKEIGLLMAGKKDQGNFVLSV